MRARLLNSGLTDVVAGCAKVLILAHVAGFAAIFAGGEIQQVCVAFFPDRVGASWSSW